MSKCKHYFSNLKDDCKIDNVKCDHCGISYYQFLMLEIMYWKQENATLRQQIKLASAERNYNKDILDKITDAYLKATEELAIIKMNKIRNKSTNDKNCPVCGGKGIYYVGGDCGSFEYPINCKCKMKGAE